MNNKVKAIFKFIMRHAAWFVLGAVAVILLKPGTAELQTFFFIICLEAMAIALSGLALFAYTKIDFTRLIMEGDDNKMNSVERHSAMVVLGHIFLGVHILVGLVVLGVYIAQFAN